MMANLSPFIKYFEIPETILLKLMTPRRNPEAQNKLKHDVAPIVRECLEKDQKILMTNCFFLLAANDDNYHDNCCGIIP